VTPVVTVAPCPVCPAPAIRIELLSRGWRFCHACATAFQVDDDGTVSTIVPTVLPRITGT